MRNVCAGVCAKFHYTGPTGPDRTRTDFVGDPHGTQRSFSNSRVGPCGSDRARVVEFSYNETKSLTDSATFSADRAAGCVHACRCPSSLAFLLSPTILFVTFTFLKFSFNFFTMLLIFCMRKDIHFNEDNFRQNSNGCRSVNASRFLLKETWSP